ncbi:MAG: hypothetical protein COU11_03545 [Candidatus Harrisonbacteria bacterium CG10_big_fil_rev_8_21_14_0_10_49_15]|uniref:Uncharacterized protein n=1 Tax=Candidatus Harrisonbacteria bacterium CG10_big_fil_rev_8_21_14_0_10_49_15 TaxID=1974587 RepID=A0A2H0UKH7_9BACT|nr:MAG: hypothetical protein COU11_03545 [Candidatus Harrisonbacteria bacterium CG10_big_fil_rev_8_21_14_0_10_49_15]
MNAGQTKSRFHIDPAESARRADKAAEKVRAALPVDVPDATRRMAERSVRHNALVAHLRQESAAGRSA